VRYQRWVDERGERWYRRVQAWGRGDILLAVARA